MKVNAKIDKPIEGNVLYTLNQVKQEPGIYYIVLYPKVRFLSFGNNIILFIDANNIEPIDDSWKSDQQFIKINEVINITFKL